MPRLSQLKRDTGTVTIPTGGDEPLVVEYRKGFVSPRLAEQIAGAEDLAPIAQLAMLADDEDTPLPLTAEAIATIDAGALQAIAQAIWSPDWLAVLQAAMAAENGAQAEIAQRNTCRSKHQQMMGGR